jgi:hypothetical protein
MGSRKRLHDPAKGRSRWGFEQMFTSRLQSLQRRMSAERSARMDSVYMTAGAPRTIHIGSDAARSSAGRAMARAKARSLCRHALLERVHALSAWNLEFLLRRKPPKWRKELKRDPLHGTASQSSRPGEREAADDRNVDLGPSRLRTSRSKRRGSTIPRRRSAEYVGGLRRRQRPGVGRRNCSLSRRAREMCCWRSPDGTLRCLRACWRRKRASRRPTASPPPRAARLGRAPLLRHARAASLFSRWRGLMLPELLEAAARVRADAAGHLAPRRDPRAMPCGMHVVVTTTSPAGSAWRSPRRSRRGASSLRATASSRSTAAGVSAVCRSRVPADAGETAADHAETGPSSGATSPDRSDGRSCFALLRARLAGT